MANAKEVIIQAEVPWDWADRLHVTESACFASLLLNPVIGVHISYRDMGYVPNENGGQTSMYMVTLEGIEALNEKFLTRLVQALASVGTVRQAEARDLTDPSGWYPIER